MMLKDIEDRNVYSILYDSSDQKYYVIDRYVNKASFGFETLDAAEDMRCALLIGRANRP